MLKSRKILALFVLLMFCFMLMNITSVYADSITDVMGDWSDTNQADGDTVAYAGGFIVDKIGLLICIAIYLLFLGVLLTTVFDLCWIGVPFLRPILYPKKVSDSSVNASVLATGDIFNAAGAHSVDSYNRRMAMNADANARRDAINERSIALAEKRADNMNGVKKSKSWRDICWVSSELRSLVANPSTTINVTNVSSLVNADGSSKQGANYGNNQNMGSFSNKRVLIKEYFKRRAIGVAILTAVTILLGSSIWMDFGVNIGKYILYLLGF